MTDDGANAETGPKASGAAAGGEIRPTLRPYDPNLAPLDVLLELMRRNWSEGGDTGDAQAAAHARAAAAYYYRRNGTRGSLGDHTPDLADDEFERRLVAAMRRFGAAEGTV